MEQLLRYLFKPRYSAFYLMMMAFVIYAFVQNPILGIIGLITITALDLYIQKHL